MNLLAQPLGGGPSKPFTHFTDGKRLFDFAWSPDFKRLAITRGQQLTDIVLVKGFK
jgi:hypothetical protein